MAERLRETVEAVSSLIEEGVAHPTPRLIQDRLTVGRQATYDRIKDAIKAGYLTNEAQRGYRLSLGTDLPSSGESYLPAAEAVFHSLSTHPSGKASGSAKVAGDDLSAVPPVPPAPRTEMGERSPEEQQLDDLIAADLNYYRAQRDRQQQLTIDPNEMEQQR